MSIKDTHTKIQKKPKLRFSGFFDAWKNKKLGDVVTFFKGKGISKDDIIENGINKCIRYGELYTEYSEIIREIKSRTNISAKESILSNKNDILIPSSGETALDIAKVSCVKESNILLGGDLNVMRPQKDQSGEFFAYYLSNFKKKNIAILAQGNSVVHLYESQLKKLDINIPNYLEQQKIAEFLESIDSWVLNLKKQKDLFKNYKKGILQKIFNKEIIFKDKYGKNFPEWKIKKIEDIVEEYINKTEINNQYPILSSSMGGISLQSDYFKHEVASKNNIGYKIVPKGYFTYRSMSDTGSFTFNIQNIIDYGIVSPAYPVFKVKNNISNIYLNYYLNNSNSIINSLSSLKQGGTRFALNFNKFKTINISLPSIEEQQKISDFLLSVDRVIESKQQQIIQAEQWKNGLVQNLFI